jgi:hypothetical protein
MSKRLPAGDAPVACASRVDEQVGDATGALPHCKLSVWRAEHPFSPHSAKIDCNRQESGPRLRAADVDRGATPCRAVSAEEPERRAVSPDSAIDLPFD